MAYSQYTEINETSLKSALVDLIYPVGSIYMSVTNTSPQSFLGGTWEAISGRFLLASDSTYTAGSTGGSTSHTHTTGSYTLTSSDIPSHYHSYTKATGVDNTTLTIDQIPSHAHETFVWHASNRNGNPDGAVDTGNGVGSPSDIYPEGYWRGPNDYNVASTSVGGNKAHNHSLSTESSNTGSTGGGNSHNHGNTGSSNNLPPYLSVYMWKRTA